jgi:branched-chain amino acid transport system permease protein
LHLIAAGGLADCVNGIYHQFWDQTRNGLTVGAIYGMIAIGYTMVYGVLQLINFAHSEVFMVGTVITLYAFRNWYNVHEPASGIALYVLLLGAMIPAMFFSGITAVTIERVAYRPLRKRGAPRLSFLISAIGASFTIQYLFNLADGHHYIGPLKIPALLGAAPQPVPRVMEPKPAFSLFGTSISNTAIVVIVVAVAMMVGLDAFVNRTRLGRGIRAVAQDKETASLMGVDIDRVIVTTFFIGGMLAGAAGTLYVAVYPAVPAYWFIGFVPGIKAFTAAVLGGIGNIRGAAIGGLVLGLVESYSVPCFGARWIEVVAFVVLVLVLMFRPTGILGERVAAAT